jgi:hypothetical protein
MRPVTVFGLDRQPRRMDLDSWEPCLIDAATNPGALARLARLLHRQFRPIPLEWPPIFLEWPPRAIDCIPVIVEVYETPDRDTIVAIRRNAFSTVEYWVLHPRIAKAWYRVAGIVRPIAAGPTRPPSGTVVPDSASSAASPSMPEAAASQDALGTQAESAGRPAPPPGRVESVEPAAAGVPTEATLLERTLHILKRTSKAKPLVKYLHEQTEWKATLREVTRHLYCKKGREPTIWQQTKARQQVRRTAKTLGECQAPLRLEWDWDRDEIRLVDVAAKPGPAKPSGKDVADVAR